MNAPLHEPFKVRVQFRPKQGFTYEPRRIALMLNELRLPTISRLWPEFAQRSDKEGWQAARLLGALLEHELAERAKRRIECHRDLRGVG